MLMRLMRSLRPVCILGLCFALAACIEKRLPDGVVATINDEAIQLSAVQTLMDSRSASLGIPHRPSLEAMKNRYGSALGALIVHALVRQELARKGLAVTDAALKHVIDQVREDFGPGGLEQFLTDASVREADWKNLMRDHLAMEIFQKRILLPGIKVSLDEARAYYARHKADFMLPSYQDICFASAPQKEILTAYCQAFAVRLKAQPKEAVAAEFASLSGAAAQESGALAQCLEVQQIETPPAWRKELETLTPPICGQIRQQDGEWRVAALAGRQQGRALELAEAYPLIESILLEEKKSAAFAQWLEKSIANSKILVAPELKESLLASGLGGYEAAEPDETEELERSETQTEREDDGEPASGPKAGNIPARRGGSASGR